MAQKPSKLIVEETPLEKLEHWYDLNGKYINIVLIAGIAVILGVSVYRYIHNSKIEAANSAFGQIIEQYNKAQSNEDEAKKKEELKTAITVAEGVAKDYANQAVGRQAQLMAGNLQYELASGEPGQGTELLEAARDSYQKYIDMSEAPSDKAAGHLAKGNMLENLSFIKNDSKLMSDAVNEYKEAEAGGKGTFLGAQASLARARALGAGTSKESQEEAIKLLNEVKKERTGSLVTAIDSEVKPLKLATGQELSVDQIKNIVGLTAWSQEHQAELALQRLE